MFGAYSTVFGTRYNADDQFSKPYTYWTWNILAAPLRTRKQGDF